MATSRHQGVKILDTSQKDCEICNSEIDTPQILTREDMEQIIICVRCAKVIAAYEAWISGIPRS